MTITAKIHQTGEKEVGIGFYGDADRALQHVFFGHNPNEDETTRQIKLVMAVATRAVMNLQLKIGYPENPNADTDDDSVDAVARRYAQDMAKRSLEKIQEASMLAVGARWRVASGGGKDPFDA